MTKYNHRYRIDSTRLPNWNYSGTGKYFITICTRFHENYFGEIINGEMKLNDLGNEVERQWLSTPAIRPDMNISLDSFQVMPNHFHGIIEIGWNKFNNLKLMADSTNFGNRVGRIFGKGDAKLSHDVCDQGNKDSDVCRDTMHCVSTHNAEFHYTKSMHCISEENSEINSNHTKSKKPKDAFKNAFGPQTKNLGAVMRGFKSSVSTYARKNRFLFDWHPKYFDVIIRDEVNLNKIRKYIRNNPAKWENDRFWK